MELTPQLFAIFAGLIEAECGIHYELTDRDLLCSKLATLALDLGFDSLLDYYYRLRYDDADGSARRALVETLLVHETYFFRELPALEQLVAAYLVPALATSGNIRVWSAACSTGEEPFSLAMLLAERGVLERVELVATDISEAAIARARSGLHGKRALRDGYPAALAQRYLEPTQGGFAVNPRIRDAVRFSTANLLAFDPARLGVFDAILCRNVLIYFRDAQIVSIVNRLVGCLTTDGVLAVGVSESLLRFGTALVCEERGGSFFYRCAR